MGEFLLDYPETTIAVNQTIQSIMKKSCLLANTCNASIATIEASIYTGITIAEYFRDMGYNVSLVADSISRWAEALRELSGFMNELPTQGGYPGYLTTRLATFYERAGKVKCIGNPGREGAVSIIGTVAPLGKVGEDYVMEANKAIVNNYWSLDVKLAQIKHFPSVNWRGCRSSEEGVKNVGKEFEGFKELREGVRKILLKEEELLGRNNLEEEEKMILEVVCRKFYFLKIN